MQRFLANLDSDGANDGLPKRFPVKVMVEGFEQMGDYTVAIWATIGLVVVFTVPAELPTTEAQTNPTSRMLPVIPGRIKSPGRYSSPIG